MTLLRDLLSQGALPKPAWVKHAYGRIRPEDAVLAWAPPTGEPLAAANEWAKRLGGEAIVIAIPETAKRYGESAVGCLTEIVVPEARGGPSQDLLDQSRMAEWRSRFGQDWPSAIVLRRLFRLPEPVPMRTVWDDTVRLQVMQQISGAARRLPDGAVVPLLDLDLSKPGFSLRLASAGGWKSLGAPIPIWSRTSCVKHLAQSVKGLGRIQL